MNVGPYRGLDGEEGSSTCIKSCPTPALQYTGEEQATFLVAGSWRGNQMEVGICWSDLCPLSSPHRTAAKGPALNS